MTKFLKNINLEAGNDVQFKTTAGANAGNIAQSGDDLVISNPVGDILLGNGSDDVYIGDGTNTVDIRFEQNMAIFADSSSTRTLTLGGTNTNLVLESPTISGTMTLGATTINNKLTFTGSNGYIVFDYEPSGDTGEYSSEVPLMKIDHNGTQKTILSRVSENAALQFGHDDTVAITAGDIGDAVKSNWGMTNENVVLAAEGGLYVWGWPNNYQSPYNTWNARYEFRFRTDHYNSSASDSAADALASNGLYLGSGSSTQFMDMSRNLKNIGTISSGAITSSSHIEAAQHFKATNNNISFHAGGTQVLNIDVNKNIYPSTDGDTDLGFSDSSLRFRNGYFTGELQSGSLDINGNADISGTLNVSSNITTNHVLPVTDSTYNVGSSSVRYANGYFDTVHGDGSNLTNITSTDSTKLAKAGDTMSGTLTITTNNDNKIDLKVPTSGDNSEWNYIQFKGSDGVRDAYFGTQNDGTPAWYRDDGAVHIKLNSNKIYASHKIEVNGELKATSLDINGNADISGNLSGVDTLTALNLVGTPADASTNSLKLGRTDAANYWYVNHAGNDFRLFNGASSGSHILFGVDSGGTVKANNVGIGTATPDQKLHVVGNFNLDGNADIAGNLVVDGGNITIDSDSNGSSLTWKETDGTTVAGQLRAYSNRGDIYLYNDGVKKTEISALSDSFIPALHIGGTSAASSGKLQVTGDVNIDGNTDMAGTLSLDDTLTVNGSGVTSQLFLTGTGNGYVNAAVVLQCNDDDGHTRGAGMYMNNVVGATEWFAGRPYSDGDSYKILRRHTTSGNHNNSTADPSTTNTTALMDIDNAGNVVFAGQLAGTSLDINGNADISGNLTGVNTLTATTFSGDLNGTINTATTATTQSASDSSTKVATTAFVNTAVANLIDGAPSGLQTLNELAEALNDDDDAVVTINTALGNRYTKTESDNRYLQSQTSHADVIVDGDFTSNGFMKRTGAGTYSVDANTYLTSLSGAVLTSSNQTIADHKTFSDDVTITNQLTVDGATDLNGTVTINTSTGAAAIRLYNETNTTQIADSYSGNTSKSYIYFDTVSGSNDPAYIMHESSSSEANEGVLHLVPSDDNSTGDYVSIHGTNDPDILKLHTSGLIETATTQLQLKSGSGAVYVNDGLHISGELTLDSHLNMGDGDIIKLGSTFQLWHQSGTNGNSFIDEGGTGDLYVRSNSIIRLAHYANNTNSATFNPAGAVELYYNTAKKFETKSDGVDITGELQADSLDIDGNADITGTLTINGTNTVSMESNNTAVQFNLNSTARGFDFINNNATLLSLSSAGNASFAGTISWGSGKGILHYGSDRAILRSSSILEIQTNGASSPTAAITLDSSQNATFAGNVDVGGTMTMSASGNIFSDSTFQFLTTGSAAQHARFKGIQVSTSYGGTLIDQGILFGTDTNLYRDSSNVLKTDDNLVVGGELEAASLDINGNADISGNLTLSGVMDILMVDNSGAAVEFKQGSDLYMRFITTNGSEHIEVNQLMEFGAGVNVGGHTITNTLISGDTFVDDNNRFMTAAAINDRFKLASVATITSAQSTKLGHITVTQAVDLDEVELNATNGATAFTYGNHASAGYLTSISSSNVTTALGFTPMNASTTTISGAQETKLGHISVTQAVDLDQIETRAANGQTAYDYGDHGAAGYAADNAVVKLAGSQTISGSKTFSATTGFTNTTQSSSKTTGAIKLSGGMGIAKTLNVGEDVVAFASSDERYKDNLQAITNPIDKVKSLTGYTFTWNDKHEQFNGNNDIGVVAQEVEKVFPEIVDTRDNGYKAVKYEKMVAVLIEAVKDQQKQIDELKAIIDGGSK